MDNIVIGEGSMDIRNISNAMETCSLILRRWRRFSRNLGISEAKILDLERKLNIESIERTDLPFEILSVWKANQGTQATLKVLYQALIDCEVRDIAESLKKLWKFRRNGKLISFLLHGKSHSLEELLGENATSGTLTYLEIYSQLKKFPETENIPLLKEEVSFLEQRNFYVPRTLVYKSEVVKQIFTDDSTLDHIFIIKDISKHELASVVGYKMIDTSGNQLHKLTVHFIILDCEGDFDRVCKITTNPVHLFSHQDNRFFWIKSSSNIETVQKFVKDIAVKTLGEAELLDNLSCSEAPFVFSISDSPGMGKSYLLTNIATKMIEHDPVGVVIFIVLPDFAVTLESIKLPSCAIQAISNYAGSNDVTKLILKEMMLGGDITFYLFLDGYDEVLQDNVYSVDSFLKQAKDLDNLKIIATTRPHEQIRLEIIFNQLSYEIHPFNLENQVEFLVKYWVDQHEAKRNNQLEQFSRQCLKALQTEMSDEEWEIAGIPLQCRMLAEVYAEDAKRASTLNVVSDDTVQAISFFEMYRLLINLKFSAVFQDPKNLNNFEVKQKYIDIHVYEAIALLFPEWLEKFQPYLVSPDDIKESMVFRIGLIEKIPSTNMWRFVHRTFAEYVFAEFLVNNLTKSTILGFIFGEIFGWNGMKLVELEYGNRPALYKLKHRVIAYFFEMQLTIYFNKNATSSNSYIFRHNEVDARMSLESTCCNDLEYCFHLSLLALENLEESSLTRLKDAYFCYLPHLVVENSKSVALLKKVLKFMKDRSNYNMSYHVFKPAHTKDPTYPWIDNCTPLHVAVYYGKYNFFTYLQKIYKSQILSVHYLLHMCLRDSANNSESVIEDKLSIIDLIISKNSNSLEEEWDECTPLLQLNVHRKLIRRMVELGSNINTYSRDSGTILHRISRGETYSALVKWALSNGFKLVDHPDKDNKTPLMWAIERFGTVDDEILKLLNDAGADFNAKDKNGESVLFYCLMFSKNFEFIKKIIEFGADVNHKNFTKENAAHKVVESVSDSSLAVDVLNLLKAKGFSRMNQQQSKGQTALDLVKQHRPHDKILRKYLVRQKLGCGIATIFIRSHG